jgi:hypothetical protein
MSEMAWFRQLWGEPRVTIRAMRICSLNSEVIRRERDNVVVGHKRGEWMGVHVLYGAAFIGDMNHSASARVVVGLPELGGNRGTRISISDGPKLSLYSREPDQRDARPQRQNKQSADRDYQNDASAS